MATFNIKNALCITYHNNPACYKWIARGRPSGEVVPNDYTGQPGESYTLTQFHCGACGINIDVPTYNSQAGSKIVIGLSDLDFFYVDYGKLNNGEPTDAQTQTWVDEFVGI